MVKSKNMVKDGRKVSRRSRPCLNPGDPLCGKGAVRKPDARPNKLRHIQVIVQGKASGHTDVFDTSAQQSMISRDGWEIIKRHEKWIDTRGVYLGGSSKAGRRLHLVDARDVVKYCLDGKSYLIIVRQVFFNLSSDETLLAEDQIECHGVKVYSCPRVFDGNQLVESRDQVGRIVKLAIEWYGSTRYLDISPHTRVDVATLNSLEFTLGDPCQPYSPFWKINLQLKLSKPCTSLDRVRYAWTNEQITEWQKRLGYISSKLVKKIFESSTQFYAGARHEREVIPNKSATESFSTMPDSLRIVRCNKETFSVDVVVDTHAVKRGGGFCFME